MEKQNIDNNLCVGPMTQTILGTHINGRPNFMALAWINRVNYKPPMLGIGVNKGNQSHDAILDTGEFSVNVPTVHMVEITDYTGLVSGKRVDKSDLFEVFYGELKSAPMIAECPLTMACKLVETVDLPTNYLFIGEIVGAYSEERFLSDGIPDIEKMNPFMLTMPDNRFWSLGECVGRAWRDGKAIRERLKQEQQS